jgi:hypothetical protein
VSEWTRFSKPVLLLDVWCPFCKRHHNHGGDHYDPRRLDAVSHRQAHCSDGSPLLDRGYYVGLDPDAKEESKATLCSFAEAKKRWQKMQPAAVSGG